MILSYKTPQNILQKGVKMSQKFYRAPVKLARFYTTVCCLALAQAFQITQIIAYK